MPARPVKSSLMKYDGTITMGNLITAFTALISVGVAWGTMDSRVSAQSDKLGAQATQFAQAITEVRESIKEQKSDLKDLQKSINTITNDTALIRGRMASGDVNPRQMGIRP